ncbi:ferredoxin [Kibdelosporangium banguiense]|uniref:Ferredoxin n=1 Tax=Kibdelosporangium banguiense TaxID=1365924 RepID=A0ABS4T8Q6_9PSEU|nr:ferredoxin [Kibdelosporangium banguiense]MBP2320797.1 ferredoxin [Kibdelosporangium banguiense]
MHVEGDRDVCVGAGMCVLTAPEVFDQDDEGIVTVLAAEPPADEEAAVKQAATLCPSGAVRLSS